MQFTRISIRSRSAEGPRSPDQRHANDDREGREDPGGIQSGPGGFVSIDGYEKTADAGKKISTTTSGRCEIARATR